MASGTSGRSRLPRRSTCRERSLDSNGAGLNFRRAAAGDAVRIAEIYNQGIRERIATFETRERSPDEILAWLDDPAHPVVVAEAGAERVVVGWAAASTYRPRECYAGIGEFSIYVDTVARGQGVGKALMHAFMEACREAGLWKLVSRVFPENRGSLALLVACGFREVGVYQRHGKLDGVWRDVVIVERSLDPEP